MRVAPASLLAAALLALGSRTARGADAPPEIALRLSYVLGPGVEHCPSEQAFRDAVARKMGYDPFTPGAPESVVVTVTGSTRGSIVTVEFNDAAHARGWEDKQLPIRDDNCIALVTGAALYLTIQFLPFPSLPLTVSPPEAAPPSPPSPAQAPAPPAPPPPSASAPPAPAPPPAQAPSITPAPPAPPSHRPRPQIEIGVGVVGALGIAPGPAFGATLHAAMRWPSWSFALEGRLDAPVTRAVDVSPGAHLKTNLIGGLVVPCWRPSSLVLLCGAATLGQVRGQSSGVLDPKSGRSIYFGAGGRAGLEKQIVDHLRGRVYVDAMASIVPAQANIAGIEAWRTSPLSGDVGAALLGFF